MFIRKKPNKSGTVSVQVVQKTKTRSQRVIKSFGAVHPNDTAALEKLMQAASSFLQEMAGPTLQHIYEDEDIIDDFRPMGQFGCFLKGFLRHGQIA